MAENETQAKEEQGAPELTFERWIAEQPEDVRGLLDSHTKGLKTALTSERSSRQEMERQLREMAGKAEKGSEMERQLTETANRLQDSDRRADFYEAAHAAGVTNLKLAWMVAQSDGLFDRKGQPDFDALKKSYPELFGGVQRRSAPGDGGTGHTMNQPGQGGMNDFIRKSAGR